MDRDDYYDTEPEEPNALATDPVLHNALVAGSALNRRIGHYARGIRAIERSNGTAGPTVADQRVIDAYRRDIAALQEGAK